LRFLAIVWMREIGEPELPELARGVAQELRTLLVHVEKATVELGDGNADGRLVEHGTQAFLVRAERLGGVLAARNVGARARHVKWLAVLIHERLGLVVNPVHAAVRPDDAELHLEIAAFVRGTVERGHYGGAIVRMDHRNKRLGRSHRLAGLDSEEPVEVAVPFDDVRLDVPPEGARAGGVQCSGQPFLAFAQGLLRLQQLFLGALARQQNAVRVL
jgi:hypothetical protein